MPIVVIALPILPGQLDGWRAFCQEMQGPRRAELEESRRRLGVTRELAFHQPTPQGDLAIIVIEAEDPQRFAQGFAASDQPFDRWQTERVRELHGIDPAQVAAAPLPSPAFAWPAP